MLCVFTSPTTFPKKESNYVRNRVMIRFQIKFEGKVINIPFDKIDIIRILRNKAMVWNQIKLQAKGSYISFNFFFFFFQSSQTQPREEAANNDNVCMLTGKVPLSTMAQVQKKDIIF